MTKLAGVPNSINDLLSSSPYGRKALEDERAKVTTAAKGMRNDQLNISTFKLSQLIKSGDINESCLITELSAAAIEVGLGVQETTRTIHSAINGGFANSRYPQKDGSIESLPKIKDNWKPNTLADAYAERPPVEYVVEGLFELPSLNIVYGAPGHLKSFIIGDLLACVASGTPWLTPASWSPSTKAFKTSKRAVMWLDFDNGARRTHDRFAALGRHYELSEDAPLTYYTMPSPWLDATEKGQIGQLILRIKELNAKVLCIDNLGTVSGNADENSAQMTGVMSNLRLIAEETECAVIAIHHRRKGNGIRTRSGESLRGHSSIEASIDLAILVEREGASDTVTLLSTKTRGVEVYPFKAAFTFEPKDDGSLNKAAFFGLASEDNSSDRAIETAIKDVLGAGPERINKGALVKGSKKLLTDVGKHRIEDHIHRLESTGDIHHYPGKTNEKLYELS